MLACSQKNDPRVKAMGKLAVDKMEFICYIHGQGSKKEKIIIIVVIVVAAVVALGIGTWCLIKCIRSRIGAKSVSAELRRRDIHEESGALELVHNQAVAIGFDNPEHNPALAALLEDMRKNNYRAFD